MDLVSLFDQKRGCNGAIHPAGHADNDSFHFFRGSHGVSSVAFTVGKGG